MKLLSSLFLLILVHFTAQGQQLISVDFSSYSDGNLAGQNGWQQYQTQTNAPITVTSGRVGWTGNGNTSANNQDVMLAFGSQVAQPTTGTTTLIWDTLLKVSSAGAAPSYFAALNTLTGTSTSGNFQNARLVAQSSGSGFVFGARVNGQSGYPFAYGTSVLNFNQDYLLRAEVDLLAGNANDTIRLYVGSNASDLALHATASYSSGTVSDPLYGAVLLSQFASSTAYEPGVSIASISISQVPEPSSSVLMALGVAGLIGLRAMRRKSS